jgi:hypothetical protein
MLILCIYQWRSPASADRAGRVEVARDPGGESTPAMPCPVLSAFGATTSQARNFVRFLSGEKTSRASASEARVALVAARDWVMAPAF